MAGLLDNEWDPYGVNIVDGTMVERMEDPTFGHPQTPPTMLYPDGIWEQTNRGQEFDEEIKVEQQAGAPDKTTTILKPKPSPAEPDLQAQGQAFNPMELWENVSAVVDAEMMTQEESNQKAEQIQTMAQGSSNAPGQSFGTPPVQPGVSADPTVPQGPQGPHMGDQSFTSPYQMPQGIQGNGPHPTNQPPPPVPAGQGFHPMEGPPPYVPQGTPPGQPLADPTAGMGIPYSDTPDQAPPGMSEGMGMEQFQPTGNQQAVTDEVVFTPEETGQRIKSGETDANRKKTEASIATAANEGTLANTVSGQDASTDPMMWEQWGDLAQNPAARKADYLKRMNMLILGGIMLDAMAAAMGVKSEAGRYMEGQMKLMEAEQKFDDQQRIYDMGRAAYYNEAGEYTPPGSQQEVFDRLMASGATISEASAMSGKHPKGTTVKGYKEYWSLKDGSNIFLPTASAPPPGYTAKRPSGAPGSDPATDPRTAAMKDEALVNEWNSQIQALEAEGNMAAANTLRQRRDNLKNRSGMAAKVGSSDARNLFTALYKSRMGDTYSDPNYFQDPQTKQDIPFDEFYNQWLNAYELKVLDGGVLRTVPGYRKQQTKNPSQSIAQATQSEIPLPDQMSSSDILEIATKQAKDLVASGKPIEEVKELWKRKGFSLDDFPEEYR